MSLINSKRTLFILLLSAFAIFSEMVYVYRPLKYSDQQNIEGAAGKLIWQKYNCQTCHQLYGLGGYLGPDLTNIFSADGKGEPYIKAMVMSGSKVMPAFQLSEVELTSLVNFLKSVDATGKADPRTFNIHGSGMISENGQ